MTCGQLRHHLDTAHGHPTIGWTWAQLEEAHTQFHEATADTATHTHDEQDGPAEKRAGG